MEYTFGDTLLQVQNLSLDLSGKKILRDINLSIKDIIVAGRTTGQIVGLMAPSGRGKTQFLKLLAGLNQPTTGTITVGDVEKGQAHSVKAGDVGMVYQEYRLFEHRSVYKNLEMVFHKGETDAQKKEKIEFYLNRFKLLEHKDKYPAQLSGGQRQRIAIIQQILCSEHYILLDEPFSGLDPIMTKEVCRMIQEIADMDEENTIIFSSHDVYASLTIADIVILLGNEYEKEADGSFKVDQSGNKIAIPGATIRYQENLMDRGLTWNLEISDKPSPEFGEMVAEIRHAFYEL